MKTAQVLTLREEDYKRVIQADIKSAVTILGQEMVDDVFTNYKTWEERYAALGSLLLQADFADTMDKE